MGRSYFGSAADLAAANFYTARFGWNIRNGKGLSIAGHEAYLGCGTSEGMGNMINVDIPGYGDLAIEHLVCDYNGTLADGGVLIAGVHELLDGLASNVDIHVVTADTFGSVRQQLAHVQCQVAVLPHDNQADEKLKYIHALGTEQTVCIGNGRNDRFMLQEARIGMVVLSGEGAAREALFAADIVCHNIVDALRLLVETQRLVATLRT